jgi:FXSXX-COOH protein
MVERTADRDPTQWTSGLLDLSDLPLDELRARRAEGDSALDRALLRVAAERGSDEPIAGFNSAL